MKSKVNNPSITKENLTFYFPVPKLMTFIFLKFLYHREPSSTIYFTDHVRVQAQLIDA